MDYEALGRYKALLPDLREARDLRLGGAENAHRIACALGERLNTLAERCGQPRVET